MSIVLALLGLLMIQPQDTAQQDQLLRSVRAMLAPALPYPETDQAGSQPANNDSDAVWMVKALQPGDTAIEVLANPLNQINQLRAARAMAQIENNIESAQRRAEDQYQRALEAVKRTGKSQDVDGVTLADEGVDGEKIDADSHATIEVLVNQPAYRFSIRGRVKPAASLPLDITHLAVASHTFKDDPPGGAEHYKEAERLLFLGAIGTPQVSERKDSGFDVVATASGPSLVVRLRGNQQLLNDIVVRAAWRQLLDLLK